MGYQVVSQPILTFYDSDGALLEDGYIYIGTANLNPETNPVSIYWDRDLTQLAPNPIRTINGCPSRNGSASRIYLSDTIGSYSVTIKNRNGNIIYSKLQSDFVIVDANVSTIAAQVAADALTASSSAASATASASTASAAAITASNDAATASAAALASAAYANMQWALFTVVDGELIVTYANGATSLPSLVDGEFIITY